MIKSLLSLSLLMLTFESVAITMPSPPPELSETLTDFRTREQLDEQKIIENKAVQDGEEVALLENPFVPGDDGAGIVRYAGIYTPKQVIGIPVNGISIVRFYDLNGVPWGISSVEVENQGFGAFVTASPSELMIKQNFGAVSTTMAVHLNYLDTPLVFMLTPVRLEREGVKVNTVINAVRVRNVLNSDGYVYPDVKEVPTPNPDAQSVKYDESVMNAIEDNLIDAVRGLGIDSEN